MLLKWTGSFPELIQESETAKDMTACSRAHCDGPQDMWQSRKLWRQQHSNFYTGSATYWLFDFGPHQSISIYISKMGISQNITPRLWGLNELPFMKWLALCLAYFSFLSRSGSSASLFPVLFLTSPCLFYAYQLCFLFPVPFPRLSSLPLPADNPSMRSPFLWFCSCSSYLLSLFCFCFF